MPPTSPFFNTKETQFSLRNTMMISAAGMAAPLVLAVRRQQPVLVAPSEPTPHELKPLSDIDDQDIIRFMLPLIQFYRHKPSMRGKDPARILREALTKALVYYYPLAGRLREWPERKLVVDCTGEGVSFIEADADVRLEEFGDSLVPPFSCLEQLVPPQGSVLGSPLVSVQVTRLACEGFIAGLRINHTMADGAGMVQFINAVGEIARGALTTSVLPVWERELLNAQIPPKVTQTHPEFSGIITGPRPPTENMVQRSFFFGPREISTLRQHLPFNLQTKSSTFDVLAATIWRSRTLSLGLDPTDEVRFLFPVNFRKRRDPPLPEGFYGNAFGCPMAVSTVSELSENSLGYVVNLIKEAKAKVTHEYSQSLANLMVLRGRPAAPVVGTYHTFYVSDVSRLGFSEVDYGWGKPVYGGPAFGGHEEFPGLCSFFVRFKNDKGEDGVVVPISLPSKAMERFEMEINSLITGQA